MATKRRPAAAPKRATKAAPARPPAKGSKAQPKAKAKGLSEPQLTIGHFAPSRIDPKRKPWAKVTFHIVPYGWQADIDIEMEPKVDGKRETVMKGSICRDWGSDKEEANAFLQKLLAMAEKGK